ncbi:MAG TPA: hypothetical protein IAB71_08285 [Candidatus Scatomonas pullistercoris]|uniref:Uncharacterized protein n=1 Tax=Candidatus Scatomonas pullistercoris TaxID=2840920 RepID=A0A9D1P3G2_9FIRM|nr:hypothetical protein [Candidatus Scatomonas pullistercoris]
MGLEDGLKKTVMAGIGAMATTAEAAKNVVDTLAKKGEQAVQQGKAVKDAVKDAVEQAADSAQNTGNPENRQ